MKPVSFPTAIEGVAREMALLDTARPAILIWQARACGLVVPRHWARQAGVMAAAERLETQGWPVVARVSGGGAVPQGPHTLNLAVVLPVLRGFRIEHGFALICAMVSEALTRFEIASDTGPVAGAFCDGAWNITVGGRKIAGTAQRWHGVDGTRVALLHAAILTAPLPASVWTAMACLHRTAGQPTMPHREAHTSLAETIPKTMRAGAFAGALARAAEDRLLQALTERQHAA
jgi:lipoate-protein ligase A